MVVIECPYCEEDIELDDDAFGLFECPYCDQEFEWGMDEEETEVVSSKQRKKRSEHRSTDYVMQSDSPALRLTAGIIFITIMAIYALGAIFTIFAGLFFSSVEEGVSDATGVEVETGIGAIMILLGFLMLAVYSTGIYFGVKLSRGQLIGLLVCSVVSVISLILTIIQWAVDDSEECLRWETDPNWGLETCAEYGSPSFPVFTLIVWLAMSGMLATLLFTPKFNHQFRR